MGTVHRESVRRPRRGQRTALVALFCAAGAVVAAAGSVSWPHLKARIYDQRIREGRNPQGNLDALASIQHPAAVPYLERYAFDQELRWHLRPNQALLLLASRYRESRFARGMHEWDWAAGHEYLDGFHENGLDYEDRPSEPERAPRLRSWLERYPGHPGRDDACLQLGIHLARSRPIEALRALHEGFHEPDGDKRPYLANWFQCVLERCAAAEDLLAWTDGDCPEHVRENVLYATAVKRMREHRFAEALEVFERWRKEPQPGASELAGWWPVPVHLGDRMAAIEPQVEACRWYAEQAKALDRAAGSEARAALLHAMGRRAFREKHGFRNHYYYEVVRNPPYGDRWLALEDIGVGNRYRQAADFFRRIAREHPGYSQIEAVEYSIPLCLWRLRGSRYPYLVYRMGYRLDRAMSEGFQAFAEKHPRSTMADEALYLAGIAHWTASGRRDTSLARRNMRRIVREHPEGDVIPRYAAECLWLREALEARALAEAFRAIARCVLDAAQGLLEALPAWIDTQWMPGEAELETGPQG